MNRNRLTTAEILMLIAVLLAGAIHLPYPFDGDQALFTVGAMKMSKGAVLYKDFWDLKQPGIFAFYLLGGLLFGFTEIGIHAFELLYLTAFAVSLVLTLKGYFRTPALSALVPLLTVGMYYAVTGSWHLTQVEGLVGFPIFMCMWLSCRALERNSQHLTSLVLSGVMGGAVILFKLLLFPILLCFWSATALAITAQHRENPRRTLFRAGLSVLAGAAVPCVFVAAYFYQAHALGSLRYAWFDYPARAVTLLHGQPLSSLIKSQIWFLGAFAPLPAFALFRLYSGVKRSQLLSPRGAIDVCLLLWLCAGACIIAVQRLSWWEYHYMLLVVPVGILAAKGIDAVYAEIKELQPSLSTLKVIGLLVCLTLFFAHQLDSLVVKANYLKYDWLSRQGRSHFVYQSKVSSTYRMILPEVDFLTKAASLKGSIFVCGNPLLYYLSGRDQAIPSNGWMLELFLPEQWAQLTAELTRVSPPYLFIGAEYTELIDQKCPAMSKLIASKYKLLRRSEIGAWYVVHPRSDGV